MINLPRLAASLAVILSSAVFAAEPEIVVGVEKSGDTFVVDARVDLPVPVRQAWGVLTDFDSMASVLSNLAYSAIPSIRCAKSGSNRCGASLPDSSPERQAVSRARPRSVKGGAAPWFITTRRLRPVRLSPGSSAAPSSVTRSRNNWLQWPPRWRGEPLYNVQSCRTFAPISDRLLGRQDGRPRCTESPFPPAFDAIVWSANWGPARNAVCRSGENPCGAGNSAHGAD